MRQVILIIILISCITQGFSQLSEPLYFREKTHDFGEVLEQNGNVDFEFVFTNNSNRPIRILSVQASCGCTTPGWTKDAVLPGKSGFIKASFDPNGRPGYFNKSLTVTTDFSASPVMLQIKGNVVNKLSSKEELLPVKLGSLRFKASSINIGKAYINKEPAIFEFPLLNDSQEMIEIAEVISPDYIQVNAPKQIEPGNRSTLIIKYDARLRNQYGFQSDNIELRTNDSKLALKSFAVYATVEEYFPTLSSEELAKSAVLKVESNDVDMGRVKQNISLEKTIKFTNSGKKNLDLRSIQSNCSCLMATFDKKILKPGENGMISLLFYTAGRIGTQNKAITIYSTDPRNPVQRITVRAFIEE